MTRANSAGASSLVVALYTLTIFASAALLFLVQPMFARMVLPLLGGTPAVWNTAVVFYQCVLLAGYAYAYAATRWLGVRQQLILHVIVLLLPLAVLPIALPDDPLPVSDTGPVTALLTLLTVAVGLPFFAVSTTSPLLQRWFAESTHARASDPYFLYGASNLGSLLALVAYPLVVERWLSAGAQGRWWAIGYLLFAALNAACMATIWPHSSRRSSGGSSQTASDVVAPDRRQGLLWLGLGAVPVSLMLSVTTYLSTDISAIPLLWIIPLVLYLLTFVLTFARRPLLPHAAMMALVPFVLAGLTFLIAAKIEDTSLWLISIHLLTFFIVAMACHGRLASLRPAPNHLAAFYLWVSLGGALGGLFNSLIVPVLFDHLVEYPLTIVIAALLAVPRHAARVADHGRTGRTLPRSASRATRSEKPGRRIQVPALLDLVLPIAVFAITAALVFALQEASQEASWAMRGVIFGLPILAALAFHRRPVRFALALGAVLVAGGLYTAGRGTLIYADRTFFGVNRVVLLPSGRYHALGHGNTLHGAQSLDPARRREPLTYFHRSGPLGQIFAAFNDQRTTGRVAVVGLGAGSTACYRRPGEPWTFYEIDQGVIRIARDTGLFTFLGECAPDARIISGDARISLRSASAGEYDLIILDAYSSDAIPIHLMTREALRLYLHTLAPDGMLAFNISNRHLELRTVLANLARDAGLTIRARADVRIDPTLAGQGMMPSEWAVLARHPQALGRLVGDSAWVVPSPRPGTTVWTDDFNSLLSVFIW